MPKTRPMSSVFRPRRGFARGYRHGNVTWLFECAAGFCVKLGEDENDYCNVSGLSESAERHQTDARGFGGFFLPRDSVAGGKSNGGAACRESGGRAANQPGNRGKTFGHRSGLEELKPLEDLPGRRRLGIGGVFGARRELRPVGWIVRSRTPPGAIRTFPHSDLTRAVHCV